MVRRRISLDIETMPPSISQYLRGALFYDSSCSTDARTILVSGKERGFLKISKRGALEREYVMTNYLHKHNIAPNSIAYISNSEHDYLFTEAVSGEDGTALSHIENPSKLASVFGEYLHMLHSLPTNNCPYQHRTQELLNEAHSNGVKILNEYNYSARDNVIIHGDYCLPNIIMDNFTFKSFIDLGYGGVGDRHYDLYWGIWTLNYNLKTNQYKHTFLDAYGRSAVDEDGLNYFTELMTFVE